MSQTALRQINDRDYDTEFKARGIKSVLKYGVAFCGKKVEVTVANEKD